MPQGGLFGTVVLSAEANELIEKSGAQSLSLGLSPEYESMKGQAVALRIQE